MRALLLLIALGGGLAIADPPPVERELPVRWEPRRDAVAQPAGQATVGQRAAWLAEHGLRLVVPEGLQGRPAPALDGPTRPWDALVGMAAREGLSWIPYRDRDGGVSLRAHREPLTLAGAGDLGPLRLTCRRLCRLGDRVQLEVWVEAADPEALVELSDARWQVIDGDARRPLRVISARDQGLRRRLFLAGPAPASWPVFALGVQGTIRQPDRTVALVLDLRERGPRTLGAQTLTPGPLRKLDALGVVYGLELAIAGRAPGRAPEPLRLALLRGDERLAIEPCGPLLPGKLPLRSALPPGAKAEPAPDRLAITLATRWRERTMRASLRLRPAPALAGEVLRGAVRWRNADPRAVPPRLTIAAERLRGGDGRLIAGELTAAPDTPRRQWSASGHVDLRPGSCDYALQLAPGSWLVMVRWARNGMRWRRLEVEAGASPRLNWAIDLARRGDLVGTLLAADGEPPKLIDRLLILSPLDAKGQPLPAGPNGTPEARARALGISVRVAADGSFLVRGLAYGRYRVSYERPETPWRPTVLEPVLEVGGPRVERRYRLR